MMAADRRLSERAREVAAGAGAEVPSPCMSVCRMDAASGCCEGCLRTLDEIAAWSGLPDEGKREVWRRIAVRARSLAPAGNDKEAP